MEQPASDPGCCGTPPPARLEAAPCCAPEPPAGGGGATAAPAHWVCGRVETPRGPIPRIGTALHLRDHFGSWRMRWAISRSRYRVEPGLYAVGSPTAESPVLVSANYKMSFDRLRSQLGGLDAWLLVLDTHGVNVWCAAGKGTFGSDELVQRLAAVQLSRVVSHRTVIVPQLGAPGVAAHEVAKRSGFRVVYGPVRAADLPAFLAAGTKATPAMRQVRFPLPDRLVLAPVEMVLSAKWAVILAACLLLLAGLGTDGYSWARVTTVGAWSAALILATCLGSVLLTAILLPWLPGRAFWVRGASLGPLFVFGLVVCQRFCPGALGGGLAFAGWCLLVPAITSFMAMNFTGVTTFTSLSGVRREVRTGGPVQAAAAAAGLILWLVGRFL